MTRAAVVLLVFFCSLGVARAQGDDAPPDHWPPVDQPGPEADEPPPPVDERSNPGPGEDPPQEAPWRVRVTGQLGGSYFQYEETLNSLDVETEFEAGSFAFRLGVEGNLAGFSPHMRLMTLVAAGEEESSSPGFRQENDLDVSGLLWDLGAGYRLDLGEAVTLVPSLSYTLGFLDFERSSFEIDGVRVLIADLDGDPLDEVGESILSHGVTAGLGVELGLTSEVDLHLRGSYTWFLDSRVDNDVGGELSTEGELIRGGAAVNVRLLRFLALRIGCDVGFQRLDKSNPKTRTGSAATATVIFPHSETLWVALGFGVEARF